MLAFVCWTLFTIYFVYRERGIGGERVRGRKRSFFGHGFGFHIPLDVAGVESSEVEVETSLVSVPLIPPVN